MRKKFALILIAVMVVTMAAGCSSNDKEAANPSETTGAAETTASAETTAAANDQKQKLIGEDRAKEIALKKVNGAKASDITKIKLETDDGRQVYDGELVYNGKEYDFEIDAVSGDVLQWDEETVNK